MEGEAIGPPMKMQGLEKARKTRRELLGKKKM